MYPTPENPHSGTFVRSQVESLREAGLDIHVLHLVGRSPWKYVRGLAQVFLRTLVTRYDVVHGHYGYAGWVARAQFRAPVVVSFCGDDLLGTPDSSGKVTTASRLVVLSNGVLAHLVQGIIVKSEEMRGVLPQGLRATVDVIPNGVDFRLFEPGPRREARARLRWWAEGAIAVFPADPSIPRKAYPLAQQAVDLLAAEGVQIELLAVHGRPQQEMVDAYNGANVVVLTSYFEGSPNVVKEAMACSVPVVAVDVGDVREVVAGTQGCFVIERSPVALAKAIAMALAQPGGRTLGREHIAHLALPVVAERVMRVYGAASGRGAAEHFAPAPEPNRGRGD